MLKTVEAIIDEHGNVRLLEPVHLGPTRRALVTILDDSRTPWSRSGITQRSCTRAGLESLRGGRRVVTPSEGPVVLVRLPF